MPFKESEFQKQIQESTSILVKANQDCFERCIVDICRIVLGREPIPEDGTLFQIQYHPADEIRIAFQENTLGLLEQFYEDETEDSGPRMGWQMIPSQYFLDNFDLKK